AFYLFYALICTLLFRGQTIGKKIMRIKVRHSNTKSITNVGIFCREFLGKTLINSIPIIPLISLFTISFTKDHKALHDMLGDTIVSDL
ncbi:MAG: RDD family protein, partial [Ruminiclostridium sp.]